MDNYIWTHGSILLLYTHLHKYGYHDDAIAGVDGLRVVPVDVRVVGPNLDLENGVK